MKLFQLLQRLEQKLLMLEGNDYSVEAIVLKAPERKDIQTKSGENIQLSEMFVEDDSGQVWIKAMETTSRLDG